MASRKRTEITVETHEVLIIRTSDSSIRACCTGCGADVGLIPPDEAVALTGIGMPAILEMVDAGDVHWVQTGTCTPLICLKSLVASLTTKGHEPP